MKDYFNFRLYKRLRDTPEARHWYVGDGQQFTISAALNEPEHTSLARDKILFGHWTSALNLPAPKTKALYLPTLTSDRSAGSPEVQILTSHEQLRAFLRNTENYPVFAKAATSAEGNHTLPLEYFEAKSNRIFLDSERSMSIDEFIEQKIERSAQYYQPATGWIFQERVTQHSLVTEFQESPVLACLRLVTLKRRGNFELLSASFKVVSPGSLTDHYRGGTTGNGNAELDKTSGKVHGIWYAPWPELEQSYKDTVFQIPYWNEAVELAILASGHIPGMGLQHWDIGISGDGPVLIEANNPGGLSWMQVRNRGVLEGPLAEALIDRYSSIERGEAFMGPKAKIDWLKRNQWIKQLEAHPPSIG